jgi:hypothetical protein
VSRFGYARRSRPAAAVLCGLLALILSACGAPAGSAGSGGHTPASSTPVVPPARPLLGVTAYVTYEEQSAVALSAPVSSGLGFQEIVGGTPFETLLRRFSGAVVQDLHVDLVFTGLTEENVRITNLLVDDVQADPHPLAGTLIPVAHQGGEPSADFIVNMNEPDPSLVRTGENGQSPGTGETFPDYEIQLTPGEQDTIGIHFVAKQGTYHWLLQVNYLVGTDKHTIRVTAPAGGPFAVTGRAAKYAVTYVNNGFAGLQLQSG